MLTEQQKPRDYLLRYDALDLEPFTPSRCFFKQNSTQFPSVATAITLSPCASGSSNFTGVNHGKLFVGGLSHDTNDTSLRRYFEKFGRLKEAMVLRDNATMNSRGFGFVTYVELRCAKQVLSTQGGHIVDGKKVEVKFAVPKGQPTVSPSAKGETESDTERHFQAIPQQSKVEQLRKLSSFEMSSSTNLMSTTPLNTLTRSSDETSLLNRSAAHNPRRLNGSEWRPNYFGESPIRSNSIMSENRYDVERFNKNYQEHRNSHSFDLDGGPRRTTYPGVYRDTHTENVKLGQGNAEYNLESRLFTGSLHGDESDMVFDGESGCASIDDVIVRNKIFVGGLLYATGHESLRKYFENFGQVDSAEVIYNRDTKKSRGFGFVVFREYGSVVKVLERQKIDKLTVDGKAVEVKLCKAREDVVAELFNQQAGTALFTKSPRNSELSQDSLLRSRCFDLNPCHRLSRGELDLSDTSNITPHGCLTAPPGYEHLTHSRSASFSSNPQTLTPAYGLPNHSASIGKSVVADHFQPGPLLQNSNDSCLIDLMEMKTNMLKKCSELRNSNDNLLAVTKLNNGSCFYEPEDEDIVLTSDTYHLTIPKASPIKVTRGYFGAVGEKSNFPTEFNMLKSPNSWPNGTKFVPTASHLHNGVSFDLPYIDEEISYTRN